MASQQDGYWSRSWALLTRDKGWFKPVLVLAAAGLVPIVGAFGCNGYALEWARLTAWGVDSAPKQKNVDVWGCICSGARAFVVGIGYVLVIALVRFLLTAVFGQGFGGLLGTIVFVAGSLVITIAQLRATIYQSVGAGYQIERLWDMAKRDTNGLLRIFGMIAFIGLVVGIIASILFGTAFAVHLGRHLPELVEYMHYSYDDEWYIISLLLTVVAGMIPTLFVLSYVVGLATTVGNLLSTTACGLWMRQFDVQNWGQSSDPLPQGVPGDQGRQAEPQGVYQGQPAPQDPYPAAPAATPASVQPSEPVAEDVPRWDIPQAHEVPTVVVPTVAPTEPATPEPVADDVPRWDIPQPQEAPTTASAPSAPEPFATPVPTVEPAPAADLEVPGIPLPVVPVQAPAAGDAGAADESAGSAGADAPASTVERGNFWDFGAPATESTLAESLARDEALAAALDYARKMIETDSLSEVETFTLPGRDADEAPAAAPAADAVAPVPAQEEAPTERIVGVVNLGGAVGDEPVTESASEPVDEPTVAPVDEPTEPASESASEPEAEPTEPAIEPAEEPSIDPTEPVVEPDDEPTAEPAEELAAEPEDFPDPVENPADPEE